MSGVTGRGEYRIIVVSPDGSGDLMWNDYAESTIDALVGLLVILLKESAEGKIQ